MAMENPNHYHLGHGRERKNGVDSISSLPDDILLHILSLIPTKSAIETSVLSKRWRHVWCEIPCLSLVCLNSSLESINKTLASHSASKITSFRLLNTKVDSKSDCHNYNSLIEFAMSHNVDKLSLDFAYNDSTRVYSFPDCFFNNSSLKQLNVAFSAHNSMDVRCNVSWTSLRDLSLSFCKFSDESFSKIMSGCPMLESLTLKCTFLAYLDLSKSMHLRRLDVEVSSSMCTEAMNIVAPHIYSLRLRNLRLTMNCNLVEVSSLTEANIEFSKYLPEWYVSYSFMKYDILQTVVQPMLEKLHNIENLTLGVSFLQMLSIAEFCDVPFPTFKVKTLTLETRILRSVVPGLTKLLKNSHGLRKITINAIECNTRTEKCVNRYLDSEQWRRLEDVVSPASWECEVAEPKLVAWFVELLLANTKTLDTMVLRFGRYIDRSRFGELSQITHNLSSDNEVSIVLK